MLKPSIDKLLEVNKSRFVLAVAAAKRAHELEAGQEPLNKNKVCSRSIGIALQEILEGEVARAVLPKFLEELKTWDFDNHEEIHNKLGDIRTFFKENNGYKPKETMWAIRSALTGRTRGADMVATIQILGKDEIIKRLENLI